MAKVPRRYIILAAFLVAVVVLSVLIYAYTLTPGPANPTGKETWSLWGMTMSHPAGLIAQYHGALETQATSNSGSVEWVWHNGDTSLLLWWLNSTGFDFKAGFASVNQTLHNTESSVLFLGRGNFTTAGHSWEFESYSGVSAGKVVAATYAYTYSTASHRAFSVTYADVSQQTTEQVIYWASTFSG